MKNRHRLLSHNSFIQMCALALTALVSVNMESAVAAPSTGEVVQGAVSIIYEPPVTRIVQHTADAVVQWQSFNLAAGERLEIVQPSPSARLVNQVTTGGLSDIRGDMASNGQIILINPRGIHHQKAAHARVGGLILSGLDLRAAGVLGKTIQLKNTNPDGVGTIINYGTIETAQGGNAALVGRWVLNSGSITGDLSSVALAVGRGADILFEGDGLINLNVTQEEPKVPGVSSAPLGNYGEIIAPGGRIFVAGSVSSRAFKLLRQTGGAVAGDSEIALAPGSNFRFGGGNKYLNHGALDASIPYDETAPARQGGRIVVIADTVESSALISAAALNGDKAGQVVIAAADMVSLTQGSDLDVSADPRAQGGKITLLGKNILINNVHMSADFGGQIFIGGKGTRPGDQLPATTSVVAQLDISNATHYKAGAVKIWAKDVLDIAGSIVGNSADVAMVTEGTLRSNTRVEVSRGAHTPHGALLFEARDLLVAGDEGAWAVNPVELDRTLDGANVTLSARKNLLLIGGPTPVVLKDDVTAPQDDLPSTLTLKAGKDIRLENVNTSSLGRTKLHADKNIRILRVKASSRSDQSCSMFAYHNILFKDSEIWNWCSPDSPGSVRAGGSIEIVNTIFH